MRPLGIYIHVPFCVRKCGYCDFLSMPSGKEGMDDYIFALIEEIKGYGEKYKCEGSEYEVKSVYIGGGTPSLLLPDAVGRVMDSLHETFAFANDKGVEVTLESNPGTVTMASLNGYVKCGINRLSIGLQSANDNELKTLGRIHDSAAFFKAFDMAVDAGFENINVDIMTAIPGQTLNSLENTLKTVTGLGCTHISAYSLILEEGTPFYEKYSSKEGLPDEDEEREMYHFTVSYLERRGYLRYEISNFSLPGYESRHNTAYWERDDYIGFGLGASSLIKDTRYKNTAIMKEYIMSPLSRDIFSEQITLSGRDRMAEYMFLGLRMSRGVSEDGFKKEFLTGIDGIYKNELDALKRDGLILRDSGRIKLTEKGIDYGNYVFSRFL
ncbi:MAG: radical SAM family heme chaperone HemW [Lachnospiraceae bacterium]|nr:radical SAM family heme chaperone HemW [Lachnospiraceae bacterium]